MGEKSEVKVRLSTVVCVFIILVLVVALGVVYYFWFVKSDNSNNMIANGEVAEKNNISVNEQMPEENNDENIKYTYEEIKGLYTYTNEESSYSLYLWENGTFQYEHFYDTSNEYGGGGIIGNYIIEDNVIKLNYLFTTGTDISLSVTKGNKELKIDSYESITFTDADFNNNKIVLKKDNDKENNELYKNHDFFYLINEYCIFNKYNGR